MVQRVWARGTVRVAARYRRLGGDEGFTSGFLASWSDRLTTQGRPLRTE
jgi:hypothetical protein